MNQPLQNGEKRVTGENLPLAAANLIRLLNFDSRARVGELLPDSFSFFLRHAFFDGLRSSLNQVLRFLETQRSDFANNLDDVDLVAAGSLKNDVEFRLLFRRSRSFAACCRARCRSSRNRRRCRRTSLPSASRADASSSVISLI
jgi:hypothetical protein